MPAEGVDRVEHVLGTPSAGELYALVVDTIDPEPDETVLAVGCGPGFEPKSLAEAGAGRGVGVVPSWEALALAANRCGRGVIVSGDVNTRVMNTEDRDRGRQMREAIGMRTRSRAHTSAAACRRWRTRSACAWRRWSRSLTSIGR